MTDNPSYSISKESISLIWQGMSYTFQNTSPQFRALKKIIEDRNWDEIPKHLSLSDSLKAWAKDRITLKGETFYFEGEEIPQELNSRIVAMATAGEDPTPIFKFWERLSKNPSFRSVKQLWSFLRNQGIPLTSDGCFLAYKSVRTNYTDHQTGTVDNKPGRINKMPRNQISDDPNMACHEGFHVGALEYAKTFGDGERIIIICKVDPADVVCVPYDSSQRKMRVCKYEVVGNHNDSLLPSTTTKTIELVEDKNAIKPRKPLNKRKFDSLGLEELLDEPLEQLRRYANKALKIIGASKIPGGKIALVSKILKVRSQLNSKKDD